MMSSSSSTINPTRRFRLAACLVLAASAIAAGCLKSELNIIIKENGSGSLDLNYSISDTAVSQFKAMNKWKERMDSLTGETNAAAESPAMNVFLDPDEATLRRELAKYEKAGITIEKLKVQAKNAWRFIELRLLFKNAADAARATDSMLSLYRRNDGNYILHRKKESSNPAAIDIFNDPDNTKLISPVLEGFRFNVRIEVPGKILESNASSKATRAASWTFDYDKDPKAFSALQTQDFNIIFEGKNLSLPQVNIPGKKAHAEK